MSEVTAIPQPLDFHAELNAVVEAAGQWGPALGAAYREAFQPGIGNWWLAAITIFAVGIIGERVACWKLDGLNQRIIKAEAHHWTSALGYGALRIMFDVVGAVLFYALAWVTLYLLVDSGQPIYRTLDTLLGAVFNFRLCLVLVRAVLAPQAEGIRPIPISNADARSLFIGVMVFAGVYIALIFNWAAVLARVDPEVLGRATGVLVGIGLGATLVTMVWRNRTRLEDLFRGSASDATAPSTLRAVFAQSWPYLFALWVCMLWANWAFSVFTVDPQRESSAMLSWWITLLFPAIDRLFFALLNKLARIKLLDGSGFEARRDRFVAIVQTCVRAILVGVALIAMALNWNLLGADLVRSALGAQVIWSAVEVGLIVLVAYVLYEVVMSMLEKHMPRRPEGAQDEIEGEGGGAGATRGETLAPLLRGVFLVVLGIVVLPHHHELSRHPDPASDCRRQHHRRRRWLRLTEAGAGRHIGRVLSDRRRVPAR